MLGLSLILFCCYSYIVDFGGLPVNFLFSVGGSRDMDYDVRVSGVVEVLLVGAVRTVGGGAPKVCSDGTLLNLKRHSSADLTSCVASDKVLASLNLSIIYKVGTAIVPTSLCWQDNYQLHVRVSAVCLAFKALPPNSASSRIAPLIACHDNNNSK